MAANSKFAAAVLAAWPEAGARVLAIIRDGAWREHPAVVSWARQVLPRSTREPRQLAGVQASRNQCRAGRLRCRSDPRARGGSLLGRYPSGVRQLRRHVRSDDLVRQRAADLAGDKLG